MSAIPRVRLWRPSPGDELIGREAEVARVLHLVSQDVSVAVVGPMWSGRTAVLNAVRRLLEDEGRSVRLVRWSPPDRDAGRYGTDEAAAGSSPASLGKAILVSTSSEVVMVDDIDELEPRSRARLRSVQAESGAPFVTSRRPHERPGMDEADVALGDPLVEIELRPLGFEHLHRLLSNRLRGPLAPDLAGRLHRDSGGLPGLAVALLDGAIIHGGVRQVGRVWTGERLWSPDLHGTYDLLLRRLPEEHREAVELLARTGPLSLALARLCVGRPGLRALERSGFVQLIDAGSEHVVLVQPAALASHLSRQPVTIRAIEAIEATLERLDAAPTDDPRVPQVSAHLRAQAHPLRRVSDSDRPDLRRSSEYGPELLDQAVQRGLAVARAAWHRSRQVPDAVRLLSLAAGEREPRALVETVLAGTDTTRDHDSFEYVDFQFKAARWTVHLGAEPLSAARELRGSLPPDASYRDSVWLLGYLLEVEFSRLPGDYEETLAPYLATGGRNQATARVVLAACRMIDGRCDEVEDLLDLDRQEWPLLLAKSAELVLGVAAFGRGDGEAAIRRGDAMLTLGLARASSYLCLGSYLVTALGLLVAGRLEEAVRLLLTALPTHGGWTGLLSPESAVRGLLVYLAHLSSPDTLDPAFLDAGEPTEGRGDALPFSSPRLIRAIEVHRDGDTRAARQLLQQLAADLRTRGLVLPADALDLARLLITADPEHAGALTEGTTRMGGARLRTLLDARQARQKSDPTALVGYGARFEELDLPYEAARAYTLGISMAQQTGQHELADRARSSLNRLQILEPSSRLPAAPGSALSVREWEIVDLVAQGQTNAQIASSLYLSVRTIDTHLRNIRRKTGAESRSEIGRLNHTRGD